jgi:hypothetical protein
VLHAVGLVAGGHAKQIAKRQHARARVRGGRVESALDESRA